VTAPLHVHVEEIDSTQQEARRLADAGAPHGSVVVADRQTAGRGRLGRIWQSAGAGLYTSFVLRPLLPLARAPRLTLAAAAALLDALDDVAPTARPHIKWPNDVLLPWPSPSPTLGPFRKIAGVLVEAIAPSSSRDEDVALSHGARSAPMLGAAIVGIGVNLSAPLGGFGALASTAAALADAGAPVERDLLLQRLTRALLARTAALHEEPAWRAVLEVARARSATLGRAVRVDDAEGIAAAIDDDGALWLDDGLQRRRVWAGDVVVRSG
jgi:BirA family biotin operon repressor/biotin-[acetyl-CoA-carboxylase] ligase